MSVLKTPIMNTLRKGKADLLLKKKGRNANILEVM